MPQYDGSIIIGTGIDTSGIKKDSKQLEKELKNLADAQKSFLEAGGTKTSPVYKEYEKEIESVQSALESLKKSQEVQTEPTKDEHWNQLKIDVEEYAKSLKELQDQGKFFGDEDYDKIYLAWKNATDAVKAYQVELNKQTESGQAKIAEQEAKAAERQEKIQAEAAEEERLAKIRENAVVVSQRILEIAERRKQLLQEIADMEAAGIGAGYRQYDSAKQEIAEIEQEIKNYSNGIKETKENYKKLGDAAKKVFASVGTALKKVNSLVDSFGKRIKEAFTKFTKSASGATKSANGFALSLKNILKYGFGIRSLYALVNKIRSAIKEGFGNLYKDNERFQNSVDNLKASILTLKNAFAAAFRPIVEVAIPYIQMAADKLTELLNKVGQFTAAIAGQTSYTKAIKQTADAFKDAKKAAEGYLSPLDEINKFSTKKDETEQTGIMFEEVPIEQKFKDMAEKVKNVFKDLFAPIKEAWNREGEFVIDSWKYGLGEIKKLLADIGRDFLAVWQQAKTIKIFQDILDIIGDIGLVVGHLARNFREAWNENKTGLHILENIRDIIGVIVHNIRLAADKTVEWADKLDFTPLLEAFERLTKSLIPLADALSGVLADFYTEVLLPLAKWTIEKGLPQLLDVFTAFNEKVDWKALRENLAEFWRHLEPFAETIGEGLIIFIGRLTDALANFLNSQEFKDFLVMIENWMDSVTPEDVADALEMIAKGLIVLKLAVLGFSAIKAITGIFTTLISFFSAIGKLGGMVISGAQLIATGIGNIIAAIGGILPALSLVAAAVVGWKIGEWINEKLLGVDTPSFFEMMDGIKSSFTDGSWKQALSLWGQDIKTTWSEIWNWAKEDFEKSILGNVFTSFTDGSWKEALHLWGEDIKSAWTEIWGYVKEDFNKSILGEVLGSFTDGTWRDALKLWGNDIYSAFVTLGERQSEWLNSLKENWSQTWENIKSKIFDVVGSIKSAIENAVEWIKSKWDSIKNSFSIGGGSGDSGQSSSARTYSMRSMMSTYSTNPAFATLAAAPIPKLATGAVIPPNKEFLAVLGDQKSGTNIEAPLDTIKQANRESLMEVMSELGLTGGLSGGSQTLIAKLYLDGKEITEAVIRNGIVRQMATGRNPFELGTT